MRRWLILLAAASILAVGCLSDGDDPAQTWNLVTTGTEHCGDATGAGCAEIFVRTVALEIQAAG